VAAIIPLVGTVIWLWLAFAIPPAHGRRRWWTVALLVPGVGLVGYWFYALSLPRRSDWGSRGPSPKSSGARASESHPRSVRPIRVSYDRGSMTFVTTQRCLPIFRLRTNPIFS
jgi:hypothetical protein